MRITFISPTANMSGGVKVIAIYAKALIERGHFVSVVSPPQEKVSLVSKLKSYFKGKGWPVEPNPASHLDELGLNHKVLESFRPVGDSDFPDSDVVIATWWETAEWVNRLSNAKGAKVYFIQGHEVYSHLPVARSRATYKSPLYKIVVSSWLRDVMHDVYGETAVDLVLNGIDHSQFFAERRAKQPMPTLGFLYSKAELKGVDITLKAIGLLRDHFPNIRVISFGVQRPPTDAGFGSQFEFFCLPAQDKIREIYAQCDVWVTASRVEGFNLPAMEAMACRTPVVSTRTGWPEEAIVDGMNGFLVEVDDIASLANCALKVLGLTDKEWQEMSQNAYMTVKDSAWRKSVDLFEKALEKACQQHTRDRAFSPVPKSN